MKIPFLTREEFEQWKADGGKPDVLFPILNYDACKYIWENSPLIAALTEPFLE